MTTLAIMATYEKKRLKCYGTVAAGEHVAVTVTDGAQWMGEGKALRLRVLFGPDTVAVFPFADGDVWTATGTQNADAACELNLNTLQAEKYLKHGGTCLWILDDVENHTLYATGEFDVLPWPKRRGIDEPIDLDGYPLLLDEIKDLKEAFEEYQRTVAQMLATKQDTIFDLATIRSGAAAGATAVQPSQIARFVDDAEYKAQYGEQNKPAILFKHGTNVIVALDATPFVKDGMVSSVAVVGGNLVITFNTDSGKQPISIPLTDIFNPANYYTKTDVDGLLAGKQDALTFDNAPTSGSNNPVKSGGIWSAIWGTASTAFSSLYDWCESQLAGKLSLSGGPMNGDLKMGGNTIGFGVGVDVTLGYQALGFGFRSASGEVDIPLNRDGTLAFVSQIPDVTALLQQIAAFPAFDAEKVGGYAVGDMVTYQGQIYECTTAHSGAWAAGDFTARTLGYLLGLKQDALSQAQLDNIAAVPNKADVSAIPYALVTKTISNNAVTLDDRASNAVTISATLSPNTLTINFPTTPTGKLRDFAMRLNIAAGVTAPEIAWPQGVTLENNGGEVPEIADGGTGGSSTILYFSETENNGTTAKFLVKCETLTAIAQA